MTKKLQLLLYVIAAYLAAFGALYIIAPGAAQELTKASHDPSLSLVYGLYSLLFALIAIFAAKEKKSSTKLSLVILLLLLSHVIAFGYLLVTGQQDFAQAGPPIIVNALLAGLLAIFRK